MTQEYTDDLTVARQEIETLQDKLIDLEVEIDDLKKEREDALMAAQKAEANTEKMREFLKEILSKPTWPRGALFRRFQIAQFCSDNQIIMDLDKVA